VQGGLSTKDISLNIQYSGLGYYSMMRNYTVTVGFKFNSLTSTSFGAYVGVSPRSNDNNLYSAYGNVDASGSDSLQILNTNNLNQIRLTTTTSSGLPAINTSDNYTLSFTMNENVATTTFTNVTAGTSQVISLTYVATIASVPRRPPNFYYTFGVAGSSDISFDYFSVTTTEKVGAKIDFIGDSIPTGYAATDFTLCYPYDLRANTSCLIQVAAGSGLTSTDGYINRNEIIAMNPTYAISGYGTNDGGGSQTTYRLLVDALEAAGIQVKVLAVVNGGDPFNSSSYNYSLRVTYFPTEFVDIWTTGWNVIAGNPTYKADNLHPTAAGHAFMANIIKTQLPTLFPL